MPESIISNHEGKVNSHLQLLRNELPAHHAAVNDVPAAKPISDPQGVTNALKWEVQGKLNGTEGVWELVIDVDKNLVLHFLFNSH